MCASVAEKTFGRASANHRSVYEHQQRLIQVVDGGRNHHVFLSLSVDSLPFLPPDPLRKGDVGPVPIGRKGRLVRDP